MKPLIILQARTSSTRLPGKALLPINGIPMVVLAALRAGNQGIEVIVATTEDSSDDLLCEVLKVWDISCFRGDIDNTLKRFVSVVESEPDNKIIVRITGDNVIPDGYLINKLIDNFINNDLDYLTTSDKLSGLPYGVSVEVTRLCHLREAQKKVINIHDREHVTPFIIRKFGSSVFNLYQNYNMGDYVCTVDTLDNYLETAKLFQGIVDPISVSLETLLEKIKNTKSNVPETKLVNKLILGTAQFGSKYGLLNSRGKLGFKKVKELVNTAIDFGIKYIDTASAYGESEQILGKILSPRYNDINIITKIDPLSNLSTNTDPYVAKIFTEKSFYKSCHDLGQKSLHTVMLHRADHLKNWHGAPWQSLCDLRQKKLIKKLGVSVQTPEELSFALDFDGIDLIQLPYNILDYRWDQIKEKIKLVKKSRKIIILARSIFLQGLILSDQVSHWKKAHCQNPEEVISWLVKMARIHTDGDLASLALLFVKSQTWIDGLVIGVLNKKQLIKNCKNLSSYSLFQKQINEIMLNRPPISIKTLNPTCWLN